MGKDSAIEWTHHTFNPWWGCTKVSAGCDHCYAETFDKRVGGAHWGPDAPRRTFSDKHWAEPLKWNADAIRAGERRRVFCASMADWADAEAPTGLLARLWALIAATPGLDWLLLTKRHGRIARSLPADWGQGYPNVWLGVTVENQEAANTRIPVLLKIPARVRFLSCEPLIGPVKLRDSWLCPMFAADDPRYWRADGRGLDWVICGGESGHGARPMHPDWARDLRDRCHAWGVAYHFKQWGEYRPWRGQADVDDDTVDPRRMIDRPFRMYRAGKHEAGRVLDGRTWDEYPQSIGAAP